MVDRAAEVSGMGTRLASIRSNEIRQYRQYNRSRHYRQRNQHYQQQQQQQQNQQLQDHQQQQQQQQQEPEHNHVTIDIDMASLDSSPTLMDPQRGKSLWDPRTGHTSSNTGSSTTGSSQSDEEASMQNVKSSPSSSDRAMEDTKDIKHIKDMKNMHTITTKELKAPCDSTLRRGSPRSVMAMPTSPAHTSASPTSQYQHTQATDTPSTPSKINTKSTKSTNSTTKYGHQDERDQHPHNTHDTNDTQHRDIRGHRDNHRLQQRHQIITTPYRNEGRSLDGIRRIALFPSDKTASGDDRTSYSQATDITRTTRTARSTAAIASASAIGSISERITMKTYALGDPAHVNVGEQQRRHLRAQASTHATVYEEQAGLLKVASKQSRNNNMHDQYAHQHHLQHHLQQLHQQQEHEQRRQRELQQTFHAEILASRTVTYGVIHRQTAKAAFDQGCAYLRNEAFEEAHRSFYSAYRIWSTMEGRTTLSAAKALDAMAETNLRADRPDKAEKQIETAVSIRVRELGPWHVDTVESFNKYAGVALRQGNHALAARRYEQVLAVRMAIFTQCHPSVAVTAQTLANVYKEQDEIHKSQTFFNLAADVYTKMGMPSQHPTILGLIKDRDRLQEI